MHIETIFFDLDDTLYPPGSGVWEAVMARMEAYMRERVGIPPDQVSVLRAQYGQQYGTTLRGLMVHHTIDPDEYLAYVHDIAIEELLRPNPELAALLARLPQAKYIFTNANRGHAQRVLAALDIAAQFDGIISIETLNFISKPDPSAYPAALQAAGGRAESSLYLDDRLANLLPASKLGMRTALVGDAAKAEGVDFQIARVEDLIAFAPSLVE